MVCPKCGANNIDGSSFCVKCGNNLNNNIEQNINEEQSNINNQNINPTPVNQVNVAVNSKDIVQSSSVKFNYFTYLFAIFIKPFTCFKEEENKLNKPKIAILLSVLIASVMTLINLFTSMISAIFVKKMDVKTFKFKTVVQFSNLKNLDYVDLIFKKFLMFVGIIALIALVYFLVALIFKKKANYVKNLAITCSSLIPYLLIGMVAAPILGKIWSPLNFILLILSIIYSLLIFMNLMNEELKFDNIDIKIYFHLICLGILAIILYYLFMSIFLKGITNGITKGITNDITKGITDLIK